MEVDRMQHGALRQVSREDGGGGTTTTLVKMVRNGGKARAPLGPHGKGKDER